MKQNDYGKEAFNLRLTICRMVIKLPLLAGLILLGTLLVGGGYYLKNVVLRENPGYIAQSVYHVEYAVESEAEIGAVYINQTSWNTYVHSDAFLGAVQALLDGKEIDRDVLSGMLEAYLASDLRVPSIEVRALDKDLCTEVHQAVDEVMVTAVPKQLREIEAITIMDSEKEAYAYLPDVRVGRAFALGAVLSCFFVIVVFLIKETWVDALWLPVSLWKRYSLPAVGTLASRELVQNMQFHFDGKEKVAVCPVSSETDPVLFLQTLKEVCGEERLGTWYPVPAPVLSPEVCKKLREADGILLVVEQGIRGNAKLEPVLEYLQQQECAVTAAIMANADERLLRLYYCLGKDEV